MDAEDQFRWFDYDVNGDYLIDYMLVLHSGFPAEMGVRGPVVRRDFSA